MVAGMVAETANSYKTAASTHHSLFVGMCIEELLRVVHPVPPSGPALARGHQLDVRKHASKLPAHIHQHVNRLLIEEMLPGKHSCSLSPLLQIGPPFGAL